MNLAELRKVAENGAAGYERMLDIGQGIGALDRARRAAIHAYDETFSLGGDGGAEVVLALLDVAEAAESRNEHDVFEALDRLHEASA